MPIAFDTAATFDVYLDSDTDKPEDSRPAFTYRHLTAREFSKVCSFLEKLDGMDCSVDDATDAALSHAAIGIVGWSNIDVPFSAAALGDVVTIREALELCNKCANGCTATPEDKKKLESPA